MKRLLLTGLIALVPVLAVAAPKATVEIQNRSDWQIHEIYLSPSDERSWGPDQLEDEILGPGDSLTLTHISCDDYDIMIVDEDGDECVLEEVSLCRDDSVWKITNKELLRCVANTD